MSLVAPNLYVGDMDAAASLPDLNAAGVTHVLNCTHVASPLDGTAFEIEHMRLGLLDHSSDLPRLQSALETGADFIATALDTGGTVLVHCHRGISRSPTVAVAYLVRAHELTADTVFEQMRAKRPIIDPNLGYMIALQEWERGVLPPTKAMRNSPTRATTRTTSPGRASPTPCVSPVAVRPPPPTPRPLSRAG